VDVPPTNRRLRDVEEVLEYLVRSRQKIINWQKTVDTFIQMPSGSFDEEVKEENGFRRGEEEQEEQIREGEEEDMKDKKL